MYTKRHINGIKVDNFTVFRRFEATFSPGLNVIIGANNTGKTHLLKLLYSCCRPFGSDIENDLVRDVIANFGDPSGGWSSLISKSADGAGAAHVSCQKADGNSWFEVSAKTTSSHLPLRLGEAIGEPECVYIPPKEMLAHAPGFRSLYGTRRISFEKVYADLIDMAFLPALREIEEWRVPLLSRLEEIIGGSVVIEGERFFLDDGNGNLDFSLVSEGHRKFALLWLLVRNGSLSPGGVLFWDEPESNLNPALQGEVVELLLSLQRAGIQIFVATHNYVLLKEIDLRARDGCDGQPSDIVLFLSLSRDDSGGIECHATDDYLLISPNVIQDTFLDLHQRDIRRALRVGAHDV